jgi:hypothetical protein
MYCVYWETKIEVSLCDSFRNLSFLKYHIWQVLHNCTFCIGAGGGAVGWGHKLTGGGFDSQNCHWNISLTWSFRSNSGSEVDSASNKSKYQEHLFGSKCGLCVGLTTLPLLCAGGLAVLIASISWIPTAFPFSFRNTLTLNSFLVKLYLFYMCLYLVWCVIVKLQRLWNPFSKSFLLHISMTCN